MGIEKKYGEIYLITCKVTGKQYVGQTTRGLSTRWIGHASNAKSRRSTLISRAIGKYGRENFIVEALATCFNRESLNAAEILLIQAYNSLVPNGYNLAAGGANGRQHPESIEKTAESRRRPVVNQYGTVYRSVTEAAQSIGATESSVWSVANGDYRKRTIKGFIFSFDLENPPTIAGMLRSKEQSKNNQKRLVARAIIDDTGKIYQSITDAASALGVTIQAVWNVMNGKSKKCKGLSFKYVESKS